MSVIARGFARSPIAPVDAELSGWHPVDLAAVIANEAMSRAQLTADNIDEVVVGCADPVGAQGADAARAIALSAGWPARIGGMVVDRGETSGAAAIQVAADAIRSGRARRIVVIGLGMASTVPPGAAATNRTYGAPWGDGVAARMAEHGGLVPAPHAAEAAVVALGLDRVALDDRADLSRTRRLVTMSSGTAPRAIVPVAARPGEASPLARAGDPLTIDRLRDWGTTAELPPAFEPAGLTTAASFAPPADSVAVMLLEAAPSGSPEGPDPGVELIGSGRAAGPPGDPTGGVVAAVDCACRTAGVAIPDLDVIEVVEATAAIVVLVSRALGHPDHSSSNDPERLNRHGGALATGDSGAAEELRLVTDAADRVEIGQTLATISAGPTGSAVAIWRRAS